MENTTFFFSFPTGELKRRVTESLGLFSLPSNNFPHTGSFPLGPQTSPGSLGTTRANQNSRKKNAISDDLRMETSDQVHVRETEQNCKFKYKIKVYVLLISIAKFCRYFLPC